MRHLETFTVDCVEYAFEVKDDFSVLFYVTGGTDRDGKPFETPETVFFDTFTGTESYGNRVKNPYKVYKAVEKIFHAYVAKERPNYLHFSTDEKKVRMYEIFVKKFVKTFGYSYYKYGKVFYLKKA